MLDGLSDTALSVFECAAGSEWPKFNAAHDPEIGLMLSISDLAALLEAKNLRGLAKGKYKTKCPDGRVHNFMPVPECADYAASYMARRRKDGSRNAEQLERLERVVDWLRDFPDWLAKHWAIAETRVVETDWDARGKRKRAPPLAEAEPAEAPAPEVEAPALEVEAPAPEVEAPAPEVEAPAPEPEAPQRKRGRVVCASDLDALLGRPPIGAQDLASILM